DVQGTVNNINTTVLDIQTNITTIDSNINNIQSTVDRIESTVDIINSTTLNIDSTVSNIESTVNNIEANVTYINTVVTNINSTVNDINSNVVYINTTVDNINTLVDSINSTVLLINSTVNDIFNTNIGKITLDVAIGSTFARNDTVDILATTTNSSGNLINATLNVTVYYPNSTLLNNGITKYSSEGRSNYTFVLSSVTDEGTYRVNIDGNYSGNEVHKNLAFIVDVVAAGSANPKVIVQVPSVIDTNTNFSITALTKSSSGTPASCTSGASLTIKDMISGVNEVSGVAMNNFATGQYNYTHITNNQSTFVATITCIISGTSYTGSSTYLTKTTVSGGLPLNIYADTGKFYLPEDEVTIYATTTDSNGALINASVNMTVYYPNLTAMNTGVAQLETEGRFNYSFILPANSPVGTYSIDVDATNGADEGHTSLTFVISRYIEDQTKDFEVRLSDFDEVSAGNSFRLKVWITDFIGNPINADSIPIINILDPLRNLTVGPVAMTQDDIGRYIYNYPTTSSQTAGVWETIVTTVVNGVENNYSDYWELETSPAEVTINAITDNTVPTISATATITNEGSGAQEYQYQYCLVTLADSNNQCGGGDDVAYASAAKLIHPGESFNPTLTLSGVTETIQYYFKLVVYYGTERSGASLLFQATSESTPTPTTTTTPTTSSPDIPLPRKAPKEGKVVLEEEKESPEEIVKIIKDITKDLIDDLELSEEFSLETAEINQILKIENEVERLTPQKIEKALESATEPDARIEIENLLRTIEETREIIEPRSTLTIYEVKSKVTGEKIFLSKVDKQFKVERDMERVEVIEVIPETMVETTDEIHFIITKNPGVIPRILQKNPGVSLKVLQKDPVVKYVFKDLKKGETESISYIIKNKKLEKIESITLIGVPIEEPRLEGPSVVPLIIPVKTATNITIIVAIIITLSIIFWKIRKLREQFYLLKPRAKKVKKKKTNIRDFLHDNFRLFKTPEERKKELRLKDLEIKQRQRQKHLEFLEKIKELKLKEKTRRRKQKLQNFLHIFRLYKTPEEIKEKREFEKLKLKQKEKELHLNNLIKEKIKKHKLAEKQLRIRRKRQRIHNFLHFFRLYKTSEEIRGEKKLEELKIKEKQREQRLESLQKTREEKEKERIIQERIKQRKQTIHNFLHIFRLYKNPQEVNQEKKVKELKLKQKEKELHEESLMKAKEQREKLAERKLKRQNRKQTIHNFLHIFRLYKTPEEKHKEELLKNREEKLEQERKILERREKQREKQLEIEEKEKEEKLTIREENKKLLILKKQTLFREEERKRKQRERREKILGMLHTLKIYKTPKEKEKERRERLSILREKQKLQQEIFKQKEIEFKQKLQEKEKRQELEFLKREKEERLKEFRRKKKEERRKERIKSIKDFFKNKRHSEIQIKNKEEVSRKKLIENILQKERNQTRIKMQKIKIRELNRQIRAFKEGKVKTNESLLNYGRSIAHEGLSLSEKLAKATLGNKNFKNMYNIAKYHTPAGIILKKLENINKETKKPYNF
ncbi:MAG: hypothetical protein KKG75_00480, partial [Nanoarchaeota archaeon]|nr:hypothetical protein [Nanoarchaeota archaeon]